MSTASSDTRRSDPRRSDNHPPRLAVEAIDLFERNVRLRMPFRFGIVTLTSAPQAFVRARIRFEDGRVATGMAAELLAPKWFDKNPDLSNEQNFDQLRLALRLGRERYLDGRARTAFDHFATHYRPHLVEAAGHDLNPLVANFGPALIDRALLDAACRGLELSFAAVIQRNLAGIGGSDDDGRARFRDDLCPDLAGFALDPFLASLAPAATIAARHTVGLVDPVTRADQASRVDDGLPETLEEVIATYGHRWFKLKVAGDVEADIERLSRIAEVLDRQAGDYRVTFDGNEQYADVDGLLALWQRMGQEARLARLHARVTLIEQPIRRQVALAQDVGAIARERTLIIDESDDSLEAFVRARDCGYTGVSSKTCKGIYRSLLNRARCEHWNRTGGDFRMSAEDLTIQAGLALQQDLALVSLLGIGHVERNGHHYVNGMADLPAGEQASFLAAHPDLYERSHGAVRLRIRDGQIALGSLGCQGFASQAGPDWAAMTRLA